MQIVALGKPLFEERNELPEAVEYNYRAGEHTLLISLKNLHPQEIAAVREKRAEFALYCENGIIFLLCRFGDALPWSDAAFSWWNLPAEDRRLPPAQHEREERILLKIILTESSTGVVKAIRVTTLSPQFTRQLHRAIREQAAAGEPLTREDFIDRCLSVYEKFNPAALAARAPVKTRGGE